MQIIADRWLELAESNHFVDPALPFDWALDASEAGRAAAWEAVAARHAPGGLEFRW